MCANLATVVISVAELHSVLRKRVCVKPSIVDQLQHMSSFDVFAYVSHDANVAASDMTALPLMDRFALLRSSLLTVLRLGLNDDVPEDAEALNRISHLEASFSNISIMSRRFLITYYIVFRTRMLVLAGGISRDIGVWENDMSTFLRDKCSETMPPGAGTIIELFPSPHLKRGGSFAGHATPVASPRSRPTFNT